MKRFFIFFVFLIFSLTTVFDASAGPFFYEGNGKISIINKNTGKKISVEYRLSDGSFDQLALAQIDAVFQMPKSELEEDVSLRLISILDYFQDKYFSGKPLTITSGYRSPSLNAALRAKGKTAGETSYHMDGMAADLVVERKLAEKIWNEFKELNYGGIGIYGGNELHVDSGKPRFWTKETALPKGKEPQENKNIYLSIDKDIYHPGEKMQIFFSGISEFPIGVKPIFHLVKTENTDRTPMSFRPTFYQADESQECILLVKRKNARLMTWTIPSEFSKSGDKLGIEVEFCGPVTSKMPPSIVSKPFVIRK